MFVRCTVETGLGRVEGCGVWFRSVLLARHRSMPKIKCPNCEKKVVPLHYKILASLRTRPRCSACSAPLWFDWRSRIMLGVLATALALPLCLIGLAAPTGVAHLAMLAAFCSIAVISLVFPLRRDGREHFSVTLKRWRRRNDR